MEVDLNDTNGNEQQGPALDSGKTVKTAYLTSISTNLKKRDMNTEYANRLIWANNFYTKKVNVKALFREFVAMRNATKTSTTMETDKNYAKCRYSDIPCLDNTRVILQGKTPENDFIHANWMTMPDGFKYISTQGPLDETIEDFWHMVVYEKVENILMICNFCEGGYQKCAQYIPTENKEIRTCGIYRIRRKSKIQTPMEGVKHQTLEVLEKKSESVKATVQHYQYFDWSDHSAPSSPNSAIKLHKIFREPSHIHPVVVHCSAGIGRTATFIGIDYCAQRIGQAPDVNMLDLVRELRKMRDKSVQTHHQYVFMIICITELFLNEGMPRNENMSAVLDFFKSRMTKKQKVSKETVSTSEVFKGKSFPSFEANRRKKTVKINTKIRKSENNIQKKSKT